MADENLGVGLAVVSGLPKRWTFASGKTNLANSIARRLQTERGTLAYAPDEGLDVRDLLSEGVTQANLVTWQAAITRECEKDERVEGADVTITPNDTGDEATIEIALESTEGDVTLVLSVDKLTVTLLEAT